MSAGLTRKVDGVSADGVEANKGAAGGRQGDGRNDRAHLHRTDASVSSDTVVQLT